MSDLEGKFRLSYYTTDDLGAKKQVVLDVGSVTNLNQSITKATSTIPLVSMGADRAFQLETGSTMQYNVSFKRKNPTDHDNTSSDSTKWSNRKWYDEMTALIDRWQMKTDGCKMTYEPDVTNPYVPEINANGYIKMLTRKYTNKYNELIEGTIQFIVGTIYTMKSPKAQPDERKYVPMFLNCGYVGEDDDEIAEMKRRYALDDIVYTIESKKCSVLMPDMPPEWSGYATYNGKMLKSWDVYYVPPSPGIPTGVFARQQPGVSVGINIPNGYKLELRARWDD